MQTGRYKDALILTGLLSEKLKRKARPKTKETVHAE